jgi:hypothetical protein
MEGLSEVVAALAVILRQLQAPMEAQRQQRL